MKLRLKNIFDNPLVLQIEKEYITDYIKNYSYRKICEIPNDFKKFTCLIIAEGKKNLYIGSGTITQFGVITSRYLIFNNNERIKRAFLVAYIDNENHEIIQVLDYHLIKTNNKSIFTYPNELVLLIPEFDYKFCEKYCCLITPKENTSLKENLNNKENSIYSFGCPKGVYGLIWHPKIISFYDYDFYIKVSMKEKRGLIGGGLYMYCNNSEKWYLLGINSNLINNNIIRVTRLYI